MPSLCDVFVVLHPAFVFTEVVELLFHGLRAGALFAGPVYDAIYLAITHAVPVVLEFPFERLGVLRHAHRAEQCLEVFRRMVEIKQGFRKREEVAVHASKPFAAIREKQRFGGFFPETTVELPAQLPSVGFPFLRRRRICRGIRLAERFVPGIDTADENRPHFRLPGLRPAVSAFHAPHMLSAVADAGSVAFDADDLARLRLSTGNSGKTTHAGSASAPGS